MSGIYATSMKTCPNCRCVYADDYNGSCTECGRGLGSVEGSNSGDLAFRYARQLNDMSRSSGLEASMKHGSYDRVDVPDGLLDVARGFVEVDHAKLKELQDA